MRNQVFKAKDLYKMIRASMIKSFPQQVNLGKTVEVLENFLSSEFRNGKKVKIIFSNDKLTINDEFIENLLKLELHEDDSAAEHSNAWYYQKLSKWTNKEIELLNLDLNSMRLWLTCNGYILENLPSEKFFKIKEIDFSYSHK